MILLSLTFFWLRKPGYQIKDVVNLRLVHQHFSSRFTKVPLKLITTTKFKSVCEENQGFNQSSHQFWAHLDSIRAVEHPQNHWAYL
jgi:hypothetical protein